MRRVLFDLLRALLYGGGFVLLWGWARGPYRFVRNPMYIGGGLVLAGFALLRRSPTILVLAVVMLLCAHLFVLLYEEPTLKRRFGDDYRAYTRDVRRWLPRLGRPQ